MLWFVAMLCLFPYLRKGEMLRVWLATFLAGLAGVSAWNPTFYVALDAMTAAFLLWKGPRHDVRQFVALCFACMALIDLLIVFYPDSGTALKVNAMIAIGWGIVVALAWWAFPPRVVMRFHQMRSPQEMRHEGV